MKKSKAVRMTMGGILLATALVAGISVYRERKQESTATTQMTAEADGIEKKVLTMPDEQTKTLDDNAKYTADDTNTEDINKTTDPAVEKDEKNDDTVETSGNAVSASKDTFTEQKDTTEAAQKEKSTDVQKNQTDSSRDTATKEQAGTTTGTDRTKGTTTDAKKQTTTVSAGAMQLFTADSVISWPVQGTIIRDYSMDRTVYFPTLGVYKCNPAVLLKATVGDEVKAVFEGTVKECFTSEETGDTVTVDMGNGYEAIYGQLKDVTVKKGDRVKKGETFAAVADPTKYYTQEGTNLYFAMTKDDKPVDPDEFTENTME